MNKEDKELLLKYICMALPYQPLCKKVDTEDDFCECDAPLGYSLRDLVDNKIIIKPYLRPMSSMTEEERNEYNNLYYQLSINVDNNGNTFRDMRILEWLHISWFLKNHFDFMNLIEKGLAIEVTENNNPYKE